MNKIFFRIFIIIVSILSFTNCANDSDSDDVNSAINSNTYAGSGDQVFHINETGEVNLTYTLDGLSNSDVYFIFTNRSPTAQTNNPTINSQTAPTIPDAAGSGANKNIYYNISTEAIVQMGTPEITEFNRDFIFF